MYNEAVVAPSEESEPLDGRAFSTLEVDVKGIPRTRSRLTVTQIGQPSRRFERAIRQFEYGSRLSRSIAGINDVPYLPNRLLSHIDNDLSSAISRSITPSWLTTRIAKDIASRVPYTHRGLSDTSALALASKAAMLDNILAKNTVPSYRHFSIPSLVRFEEYELMSPYALNQYKPLNQFGANPCGIDLIEYEVVELLEYNGFRKTLYHYQDAVSAFRSNIFTASNSQVRTSFESFVIELCYRVTKTKKDGAISAIDYLENKSFLSRESALFLRKFWTISHTNGAHPGYAYLNQAKGRLFIITGIFFDLIDLLARRKNLTKSIQS